MTSSNFYFHNRNRDWRCSSATADVINFHRSLDNYARTPLVALPQLAIELGVAHVFAKNESMRLGLPAFKALGASWALHRATRDLDPSVPQTIVTATDGNHGRAVARFAKLAGHRADIWIPLGVHPSAIQAIVDEGAEVHIIEGSYDDAVAAAASAATAPNHVLVQDTAWEGYEEVPRWIVDGYETLFSEIDEQLAEAGVEHADLVAIPTGVGSLLQAGLAHYRSAASTPTAVMSVEPEAASCVAPSLKAGHAVTVETGQTVMSGLNCGTPSSLAWPYILNGLDAAVSVSEVGDIQAAHDLAALGIPAGPCGASGLAGLRIALTGDEAASQREHLGIDATSTVVFIVTEGSDANPVPALP